MPNGGTDAGVVPAGSLPDGLEHTFYRRVLDELPGPVLVVDATGKVIYGNRAMMELGGWSVDDIGASILDHLHPDDIAWVADAFLDLASERHQHVEPSRNRWAAIQFRMIASDGTHVPIEVTGTGALFDPEIGGMIYDVRPAVAHELLSEVLTGIASGMPADDLLNQVVEIAAAPPIDLDVAIISPNATGGYELIVTTSPELDCLASVDDPAPWTEPAAEVQFVPVAQLPDDIAVSLTASGYQDLWHVAVESRMTANTFRIIGCSPTHHVPANGIMTRLLRARDLAAVVLLRTQTDMLLAHAAFHDQLTQLTNRAGLMSRLENVDVGDDYALIVLYIDLDDFKPINDEFGHDGGDRVLQVTAERLRAESRSDDLVARVGGDEFVVVFGTTGDRASAEQRAEATADRFVEAIGQPIDLEGTTVRVSASIGAVVSESEATIRQLLTEADRAMFEAKRAGGGRRHISGS